MLPENDFARQLDAKLAEVGNGPDAVAALLAALDLMPAAEEPEFQPGPEDFAELDDWLERLEYEQNCNARFV